MTQVSVRFTPLSGQRQYFNVLETDTFMKAALLLKEKQGRYRSVQKGGKGFFHTFLFVFRGKPLFNFNKTIGEMIVEAGIKKVRNVLIELPIHFVLMVGDRGLRIIVNKKELDPFYMIERHTLNLKKNLGNLMIQNNDDSEYMVMENKIMKFLKEEESLKNMKKIINDHHVRFCKEYCKVNELCRKSKGKLRIVLSNDNPFHWNIFYCVRGSSYSPYSNYVIQLDLIIPDFENPYKEFHFPLIRLKAKDGTFVKHLMNPFYIMKKVDTIMFKGSAEKFYKRYNFEKKFFVLCFERFCWSNKSTYVGLIEFLQKSFDMDYLTKAINICSYYDDSHVGYKYLKNINDVEGRNRFIGEERKFVQELFLMQITKLSKVLKHPLVYFSDCIVQNN